MFKTDVITQAHGRAVKFGVGNVVVAANAGASVLAAREACGPGYQFFAAGNPATSHEQGLCPHDGIAERKRLELEQAGIRVVLHDQTLLQGQLKCDAALA